MLAEQQTEVLAAGLLPADADQPVHLGEGCAALGIREVARAQPGALQ
jgi:hypothetical protein